MLFPMATLEHLPALAVKLRTVDCNISRSLAVSQLISKSRQTRAEIIQGGLVKAKSNGSKKAQVSL